ncbi:hypothetical protein BGZ49_002388 [Haplosporangium sp. Z 27]|nr:hypothetical protein BGZ49_002388 [Haplosporangium sp. Z 27]
MGRLADGKPAPPIDRSNDLNEAWAITHPKPFLLRSNDLKGADLKGTDLKDVDRMRVDEVKTEPSLSRKGWHGAGSPECILPDQGCFVE